MEISYIIQENCTLQRCENHLTLMKKGHAIGTIPLAGLKTIVLLSNVQITSPALNMLFDQNIDVIYMSRSGQVKGKLYAQTGGGAIIRLAQHSAFLNPERRLAIAREMVRAKVRNQVRLIEKYVRYYALTDYDDSIARMHPTIPMSMIDGHSTFCLLQTQRGSDYIWGNAPILSLMT